MDIEEGKIKKRLGANDFYIAGAGASAGGLDAFTALVKAIKPGFGVVYILLQHFDPARESLLPDLLQKRTDIPIVEITDGLEPQLDHIYVQPSNKLLSIANGKLMLEPLPKNGHSGTILIDHFFKSLANHQKNRAIGIVFSGTASDGSAGLQEIAQQGGITIAQSELSAKWPHMPHTAATEGMAQYILPPEKIPGKILELIKSVKGQKTFANTEIPLTNEQINKILVFLHQASGKDFSQYKKTTLGRRIERRMYINAIADTEGYYSFLKKNKEEQVALGKDLLIPVTEFFRDPEDFEHICAEILPQIISRKKAGQNIRIWVAGCSTGQEAYSVAICLTELLSQESSNIRAQIIATDISQTALVKARKGVYSAKEVEGVSKKRLDTFFKKSNKKYQVNQALRDMCLFAEHNFLSDPPFNNLDLISCRNVLIYMEPVLKKKAITNFHYGLVKEGLLWLGKTEANTSSQRLFDYADKSHRLFERKDVPAKIEIAKSVSGKNDSYVTKNKSDNVKTDFEKITDTIVLENYTPTGVVVNGQMEIVHYRGDTQNYLMQRSGTPSHNLLKLAKTGLAFELRSIIKKARKEAHKIIKTEVPLQMEGYVTTISIEAIPLEETGGEHVFVLFNKQPDQNDAESGDKEANGGQDPRDRRIAQLERELVQTREDMRAIVENQEVANEELQSANEELMSSSEELQTLNEELETSKEELQSANEEITVANQELRELNDGITQERNFAQAVIRTLREPLLILDRDLKVRSSNRSFYRDFRVSEQDTEGKLVYRLGNGQWDIPQLRTLLENILEEQETIYDYEVTHDFEFIGARTMLLNASQIINEEKDIKLILLTIEDITERKKSRLELEKSKRRFDQLIETSTYLIAVLEGDDFILKSANDTFLEQIGKGQEIIGKPYLESVPQLEEQGFGDLMREVYRTGENYHSYEAPIKLPRNGKIELSYYNFVYQPQRDLDGDIIGIAIIASEVTPQAELNKKIKDAVHEFEEFIYSSPSLISIYKGEELRVEIANEAQLRTWGRDEDVIGRKLLEVVPELKGQGFDDLLLKVLETGEAYHASEVPAQYERNGKMITDYYDIVYQPQRNREGEVVGVAAISNLVTPQAKFHKQIEDSEKKFREMTNLIPDKITLADAQGQAVYCNQSWKKYLNISEQEFFKLSIKELGHPDDSERVEHAIKEHFANGLDVEVEARIKNASGEYLWHLVRARPIKDGKGKILSWITAATQVHRIKQEEKRKEDFLKMVSHELKTPVTSIKGYSQLLLSMLKEKKTGDYTGIPLVPSLERINNQVSRLTRLISEMLDLSRMENSKLDLKKEIFSMVELVELNVKDIEYSNMDAQILIKQKEHFRVNGDKDRLGQVLINFITNAIKYSPNDKNIEITVYKTGSGLGAVAVKDNGIGIAKEDQANIFKRFYRVSGTNEETYSGFGIGLYLSYEIIKRHGGTIEVNSKLGEGSEFIFILPTID